MCCDTKLAREVCKFCKKNNLRVYGGVGIIMSTMVIIDVVTKLGGETGTAWSPLRMLGPTLWLPLTSTVDKLMAAQTLVHSFMYVVACCYLIKARSQKNVRLMGPWLVMHCFFMTYQVVLVLKNRRVLPVQEIMLGFSNFVVHVMLLLTASYTGKRWAPRARRRGEADVPAGTELQPTVTQSEEDPNTTSYSEGPIEVIDEWWRSPPSYDTAIRSPRSSLAQPLESQGGSTYVSWPWLWRLNSEAEDLSSAGIEMQIVADPSDADPPTYEAAAAMAAEAALRELEVSGAQVEALAGPRTSEAETGAAGESQMSGGGEEPRASHTGWFDRRRVQSVLGTTRADQLPGGSSEQASAPRRRSAGGSDTATEHPLLQPSQ